MKKPIFLVLIFLLVMGFLIYKINFFEKTSSSEGLKQKEEVKKEDNDLRIVSTSPNPLEGAVILPTQEIEFKFNKQLSVSEFKHKFDPEVEHEVKTEVDETEKSTIVRITFKKPLELGSGYTLFVLANTISEDNKLLSRDFVYHFSTIKYKGV